MRLLLLAVIAALPAAAHADEAAERGEWLARQVCSNCHTISARAPAGRNPRSPPFSAIAARPDVTAGTIATYVRQPHANMPDHGLTARQAQDLAAFILAQKPR
ncbi:cytochrome c [Roseomonas stagni]|uniref:Cytochrome c n=1 Tax=Falsiroseomonas algicola TaxID=2716930 RepID=A0A6M1LJU9_9PROT|nr:c-type cytochrome [Falsiroseomonas algicola]NGM20239.1 cytochrome c [Falsiroseomonas algicola]